MPIENIDKHNDILLQHFKKMLEGPTQRTKTFNELKGITRFDEFKARLEVLCSDQHGQESRWEPGILRRGSKLRKRLEFILQLMNDVYFKPISLTQLQAETVEQKGADWLHAADFYHKQLHQEMTEKDHHSWLADPMVYGGLFRDPTEFAVRIHEHKKLTLSKPIKCYLYYIDDIVEKENPSPDEIKNLMAVFAFVASHLDPSALKDRKEHIFTKIIEARLIQRDGQIDNDDEEFKKIRAIDKKLFDKVFEEKRINFYCKKVKSLLDPFADYLNDKPDETGYRAILTRLQSMQLEPDELANLFYYELGMLLSIEQFRYSRSGGLNQYVEHPALHDALQFICDKLQISLAPQTETNKYDHERFLNAFSVRRNELVVSSALANNEKFVSPMHEAYDKMFSKAMANGFHPEENYVTKIKRFINQILDIFLNREPKPHKYQRFLLLPASVVKKPVKKDYKDDEGESEQGPHVDAHK